jgi:hypothetical protein
VATVLLVAVGTATAFGVGTALRDDVYVTSVEVALVPVAPRSLYDPTAAEWSDQEAMARELAFIRGDAVQQALEAELDFPHELRFSATGTESVHVEGRSEVPELAAAAAAAAGATYGAVREAEAEREADAIIAGQTTLVAELEATAAEGDDAAAASLDDARARLEMAVTGRELLEGGTAYVVEPPVQPCCAEGPAPRAMAVVGFVLGAGAGAALVWLLGRAGGPEAALVARTTTLLGAGPAPAEPAPWRTGGPRLRALWSDPRAPLVLLAVLVLVRFLVLALQGTNLILDDIALTSLTERGGFGSTVPSGQDLDVTRPGAWLTFTLVFGAFAGHPLLLVGFVTLVNVGVAWALLVLLRHFLADRTALWVAVLWVVLPTHTTLTAWPGTVQVVVGLLLLLLGAAVFVAGRGFAGAAVGGLLLAASILCYEIAIPAALLVPLVLGAAVLPFRPDRLPARPLRLPDRGLALVPVVAASAWSLTHSIYDVESHLPDLLEIWTGHLGIGLYGSFTTPEWLIVASGALVAGGAASCLVVWLAGQRGRDEGPSLVVVGLLLMGVGLPVAISVGVTSLGFGDRVFGISSIGSALVLVGVGTWLWARSRTLARVGAAALLVVCLVGQLVALRSWGRAGDDVVALLDYVDGLPDPAHVHVWVTPGPLSRNGVLGVSSPVGGANEAFLRRHPEADPDGPNEGEPPTGSVTIADAPTTPPPEGALVVTWDQVLRASG